MGSGRGRGARRGARRDPCGASRQPWSGRDRSATGRSRRLRPRLQRRGGALPLDLGLRGRPRRAGRRAISAAATAGGPGLVEPLPAARVTSDRGGPAHRPPCLRLQLRRPSRPRLFGPARWRSHPAHGELRRERPLDGAPARRARADRVPQLRLARARRPGRARGLMDLGLRPLDPRRRADGAPLLPGSLARAQPRRPFAAQPLRRARG